MNWKNISLYQFQEAEKINSNPKIDDFDKLLFTACIVFDKTEHQLDMMDPKKASKLIRQVEKIFNSDFKQVACNRVGKYFIEYNVSELSFGQYVELSYFLQGNVIQNAHYILASITHFPFSPNKPGKHRQRSDYFLHKPITKTLGAVTAFIQNFSNFNREYKNLFGLDREHSNVEGDIFNKRYGWQFSAREIAKDEGITLDQVYKLPVRQALNSLNYLKAKGQYEERQMKNNQNKASHVSR